MKLVATLVAASALAFAATVVAEPADYTIDPSHTYPSFEADHMGISVWRGKMNKVSGTLRYDQSDGTGSVDLAIDPASIDFGQTQLNGWATGKDFFDVKQHPTASYRGRIVGGAGGAPGKLVGDLTLHGVTRPVTLTITKLKCIPHPMLKREVCGADAVGEFDREAFGLAAGKDYGFDMKVALRVQVEAIADR